LEGERQVARAVPLYTDASRQGLVAASVRLMELYSSGADGVARNYIAAVRFKDLALQQGAKLEYYNKR
jgi:TPR repeat protein